MILIADSGSTKTHWRALLTNGDVICFESNALNPYHTKPDVFTKTVRGGLPKRLVASGVTRVFFYGAGCAYLSMQNAVKTNLASVFCNADIKVASDLMGAAHALFGNSQGLAIILGTGANVAYYNGVDIIRETPSLGYVLGDEGSGAHLGREFVRRFMYKEFPEDLMQAIGTECDMSIDTVLQNVYSSNKPAAYLASLTRTIAKLISHKPICDLVEDSFRQLASKHLLKYPNVNVLPIGVVGSVGCVFKQQLSNVLAEYGLSVATTLQYPIDALVGYHKGKL